MTSATRPPRTPRARIVRFLWCNMPRVALAALIVLVVALGWAIYQASNSIAAAKAAAISKEKPPVNTVTLRLAPTTIRDKINLPGAIEPWTQLRLLAKIRGTITEVMVKEGDHVTKGQVLARLEDDDYRIALARARAAFALAKADFERDKSIYAKGVIPTADLEARKTKMECARADLEDAQLQYSRCTIISPMDGVVNKLDAKVGLLLAVGDPIAEILELNRVKAVVGIPESDVSAVRGLDTIGLTIQALDNEKVRGTRRFLSPAPDSVARLYRLELEVDNSEGHILPGMFVRADIVKEEHDHVIAVPFYSVVSRNKNQFVFVERDGLVEKREVRLGIMEKWMVEIVSGLHAGDNLVVEGQRDVEDQQRVRVVKKLDSPGELTL